MIFSTTSAANAFMYNTSAKPGKTCVEKNEIEVRPNEIYISWRVQGNRDLPQASPRPHVTYFLITPIRNHNRDRREIREIASILHLPLVADHQLAFVFSSAIKSTRLL